MQWILRKLINPIKCFTDISCSVRGLFFKNKTTQRDILGYFKQKPIRPEAVFLKNRIYNQTARAAISIRSASVRSYDKMANYMQAYDRIIIYKGMLPRPFFAYTIANTYLSTISFIDILKLTLSFIIIKLYFYLKKNKRKLGEIINTVFFIRQKKYLIIYNVNLYAGFILKIYI